MVVYVIGKDGKRLMPTVRFGHVRKLLQERKARVYRRKPFTIQLKYDCTPHTQDLELCMDTGDHHIGVSLKSNQRNICQHNMIC